MNWGRLLFSGNGRIGRRDFWAIWVVITILGKLLEAFGLIGDLFSLTAVFPLVCLLAKRLHDAGRSGWLAAWVFGPTVVGAGLGSMLRVTGGAASTGVGGLVGSLATVVCIVLGVGLFFRFALARGQAEANAYGPVPTSIFDRRGARPAT